jgi:hypothetical protein
LLQGSDSSFAYSHFQEQCDTSKLAVKEQLRLVETSANMLIAFMVSLDARSLLTYDLYYDFASLTVGYDSEIGASNTFVRLIKNDTERAVWEARHLPLWAGGPTKISQRTIDPVTGQARWWPEGSRDFYLPLELAATQLNVGWDFRNHTLAPAALNAMKSAQTVGSAPFTLITFRPGSLGYGIAVPVYHNQTRRLELSTKWLAAASGAASNLTEVERDLMGEAIGCVVAVTPAARLLERVRALTPDTAARLSLFDKTGPDAVMPSPNTRDPVSAEPLTDAYDTSIVAYSTFTFADRHFEVHRNHPPRPPTDCHLPLPLTSRPFR